MPFYYYQYLHQYETSLSIRQNTKKCPEKKKKKKEVLRKYSLRFYFNFSEVL